MMENSPGVNPSFPRRLGKTQGRVAEHALVNLGRPIANLLLFFAQLSLTLPPTNCSFPYHSGDVAPACLP
jgi:hypothetical protein